MTDAESGLISRPVTAVDPVRLVKDPPLDAGGGLAVDRPCHACGYNLRTIDPDGQCPECGARVVEAREAASKKVRPDDLSIAHITVVEHIFMFLLGIVLPLICLLASLDGSHIAPDWQQGNVGDYFGMMYGGRPLWWFLPVTFASMAAIGAVVFAAHRSCRRLLVRAGVYTGLIVSLGYQFILTASTASTKSLLHPQTWLSLIAGLAAGPIGVAIGLGIIVLILRKRKQHRKPMVIAFWILLGIYMLAALVSFGNTLAATALLVIIAAPHLTMLAFAVATLRLLRSSRDEWLERRWWLLLSGWLAAYGISWFGAVRTAIAEYEKLPTTPPQNCYISAAAAGGHARFVGAYRVAASDGVTMTVNRQMSRLKAGEIALRVTAPRVHRVIRTVYDAIGPVLAGRLSNRWLADLSYAALWPLEQAVRALLLVSGAHGRIDRLYGDRSAQMPLRRK